MTCKTEWWKSLPWNIIKKKRMKRNEDSLRDLWNNVNTPAFILYMSQKEKGERPREIFEEIIAEYFPNIRKETVNQVQEVQRVPVRINPRRNNYCVSDT